MNTYPIWYQFVASVLPADRQYIQAAQDRIAELERENSKLRARAAYYEKQYHEFVPEECFAWIDQENVPTSESVFHETLVRFLEHPHVAEAFDAALTKAHLAWVEHENIEAMIASREDY
jgi:hypothetical protein